MSGIHINNFDRYYMHRVINLSLYYWFATGNIVSIPPFPIKTVHNRSFTHVMSKALEAHYVVLKKRYTVACDGTLYAYMYKELLVLPVL